MRKDADLGLALEDGLGTVIPGLTDFRRLMQVLAVRARLEIAQGKFDQALETIKIGMAAGRHLAQGAPTLVTAMVGAAIQQMMFNQVTELIACGGPNLYWALAEMPDPLVDLRPAFNWERQWLVLSMPELAKAQAGPISPDEAVTLLKKIADLNALISNYSGENLPAARGMKIQTVLAMRFYEIGKRELIRRGRNPQQVQAMPAAQVAALYLVEDYFHWRDEMFKWCQLPYWQARPGIAKSQDAFRQWVAQKGQFNPLTMLLPAMGRAI